MYNGFKQSAPSSCLKPLMQFSKQSRDQGQARLSQIWSQSRRFKKGFSEIKPLTLWELVFLPVIIHVPFLTQKPKLTLENLFEAKMCLSSRREQSELTHLNYLLFVIDNWFCKQSLLAWAFEPSRVFLDAWMTTQHSLINFVLYLQICLLIYLLSDLDYTNE